MELTLDPELEEKLQRKIENGEYASLNVAVNEAVRRLFAPAQDRDDPLPLDEMRQLIARTESEIEQGKYTSHNADSLRAHLEKIKADGRSRLAAANEKASSDAV